MIEKVEWAERYGTRDMSYIQWHRNKCGRHIYAVDIDSVEYCACCGEILALIELAQDVGQNRKTTTITVKLSSLAKLPAYLVFYKCDANNTPVSFRMSQLCPHETADEIMDPFRYQLFLMGLRYRHSCYIRNHLFLEDMIKNLVHFTYGVDGQKADNWVDIILRCLETFYPRQEIAS